MLVAPPTANEDVRIALLHSLQLLDSPPEDAFDRITGLAARMFDVPIALISLVDRNRQWFKSCFGLDLRETPRGPSFCAHAIHGRQALVVHDALADPRFADNPLVLGPPHLRFYAGIPLLSTDGVALGTLCIIDRKPRTFATADRQALQDFAELARREIMQRETAHLSQRVYQYSDRVIEESEARFRATFQQAAMGIAIVGIDGSWVKVNDKLCDIVGYSEQQLLQLTFHDITHPDDIQADMQLVEQMLKGDINQYSLEKRYIRNDGEIIWINLSVSLLRDSAGKPLNFISIVEDIQARKETECALRRLRRELEERVQTRTAQLQQSNENLLLSNAQLHRSEDSLRAREAQLSAVLENAQDAYVAINQHGLITDWNPQAELTFGWPREQALGRRLDELIIPSEYRDAHRHGMKRFIETGAATVLNKRLELSAMRRDGSKFPIEIRISPLPSESGHSFCAFMHDISERKHAEQALLKSQQELRTIANNLPVQISYIDADLVVRFVNEAYRDDVGIAPEIAVGKHLAEVVNKSFYQSIQIYLDKVLAGERVTFETTTHIRQRECVWNTVYIPDIQNDRVVGFYIMSQDITARKQLEISLEYKANRDALTGLPNRSALLERFGTAISRANRSSEPLGVLFLDLDGFKAINDRYGHDGGDSILKQFAQRLTHCVRESDTVARLAGDEFVILLESIKHGKSDAEKIALKILQAMREPFVIDDAARTDATCTVGTSIGIYVRDTDHSLDPEQMIAQADQAMYRAKRDGKNRLHLAKAS